MLISECLTLTDGKSKLFSPFILDVSGKDLSGLRQEAGGHRIQRIPPTEKRGRVHTSSVTVAVFDSKDVRPTEFCEADFRIEWFSGTGAGGQHRNKCQNSCRVIHGVTGLSESRQGRSREANKRDAIVALSEKLGRLSLSNRSAKINQVRSEQIGEGFRGDKIRTYRQKDDLVTNHLNGRKARYKDVMRGNINQLWT